MCAENVRRRKHAVMYDIHSLRHFFTDDEFDDICVHKILMRKSVCNSSMID